MMMDLVRREEKLVMLYLFDRKDSDGMDEEEMGFEWERRDSYEKLCHEFLDDSEFQFFLFFSRYVD